LNIKKDIEYFSAHLFWELNKFDESLQTPWEKPYFFRIYKDARFAKGKPFKNHFWILIWQGWKPAMHQKSGYYFHIEPGNSFIIWWIWRPEPCVLKALREDINNNSEKLREILNNKILTKNFELRWDKVKTVPKWYKKDNPNIDLLRYKDFYVLKNISDNVVLSDNFFKELIKLSKIVYPLWNYINNLTIK
jgi:uncharacterized protein (TIGR02453 family)